MSERKNCEGIVQDVILIGAPCTAQANEWNKFKKVVAGRIVNGYCRYELFLIKFIFDTILAVIRLYLNILMRKE